MNLNNTNNMMTFPQKKEMPEELIEAINKLSEILSTDSERITSKNKQGKQEKERDCQIAFCKIMEEFFPESKNHLRMFFSHETHSVIRNYNYLHNQKVNDFDKGKDYRELKRSAMGKMHEFIKNFPNTSIEKIKNFFLGLDIVERIRKPLAISGREIRLDMLPEEKKFTIAAEIPLQELYDSLTETAVEQMEIPELPTKGSNGKIMCIIRCMIMIILFTYKEEVRREKNISYYAIAALFGRKLPVVRDAKDQHMKLLQTNPYHRECFYKIATTHLKKMASLLEAKRQDGENSIFLKRLKAQ